MQDAGEMRPTGGCPVTGKGQDDPRKTLEIAKANRDRSPDVMFISGADAAKAVLRSQNVKQAGFTAEIEQIINVGRQPVIVLDGPEHRRQRAATARFFSPKVVTTRYLDLMDATAADLIARLRKDGEGDLGELAMEMATAIAAEIVGLTHSEPAALAGRLLRIMSGGKRHRRSKLETLADNLKTVWRYKAFEYRDVRPAIRARIRERRQDVVSHLIDEGYNLTEILSECMSYAAAGMVTTKEFIVVAFWHMMDDQQVRERFMASDRKDQVLMLEEILRLEPIIGVISRRSTEDLEVPTAAAEIVKVPAGTLFRIDVRDVNIDETAVGKCPRSIDADRPVAQRAGGSMFAFGDGVHRCPGHQVAMYESAVFLEALFKVPGLKIVGKPELSWAPMVEGYEIHGMTIACDPL